MAFNATFYNISVISWQSVLLVEETTEYPEKTTDQLYYIMLYQVHLAMSRIGTPTLLVLGTDCIGSCKSNYHRIKTTTAPSFIGIILYI